MPRTYLIFGDIDWQARRAQRRMHQVRPQGRAQRRLSEARLALARSLRLGLSRAAEGIMTVFRQTAQEKSCLG